MAVVVVVLVESIEKEKEVEGAVVDDVVVDDMAGENRHGAGVDNMVVEHFLGEENHNHMEDHEEVVHRRETSLKNPPRSKKKKKIHLSFCDAWCEQTHERPNT